MARPIDAERIERKLQLDISHCSGDFNKAVLSMFLDYIKSAPTLTWQKEPLTPEQLLEMDGSPVWIKSESVWGLVQAWDPSDIDVVCAKPRGNFKAVPAKMLELYPYPLTVDENEVLKDAGD